MDLIYADEVYAIQGAIYEVYKNVGTGFLESVYQECLEIELGQRGIPFEAQREIDIDESRKIVVCEYCGRILVSSRFAEEQAEEEPAKKATAKKK